MMQRSISVILYSFISFSILSCKQNQSNLPFKLEDGLEVKLVASEPLISDPVDLEFDTHGNLWVLEMPGYPFEDSTSRVKVLKDTNQDGIMDQSVLFANSLNMATSILHYKEGLLVTAPPYLLYLYDQDQNQVADKVDTLMGGFSTGNLQHNANGMRYGLDQWIYFANGGNDGNLYWWGDEKKSMELNGQDFRISINERKMEKWGESPGGYGIAMDEYGRYFGTHNTEHVSQLVFPGYYFSNKKLLFKHTLHNISDHDENGLSRIYPVGEQESRLNHPEQSGYFSGGCGISYYGDDELGSKYKGTIWVADVVLNLIHADRLELDSSSVFRAKRLLDKNEVLASTDRSFRPVNTVMGPEGAVYVVDMYRKVIEHPEWIPDEIEKNLDLNAGKGVGRIYKIQRENQSSSFAFGKFEKNQDLIDLLAHKNQWVRGTAQRLLLDREWNDEMVNGIRTKLKDQHPYARLHAAWILHLKKLLTKEEIIALMKDADSGIRENILKISESYLNDDVLNLETLKLLSDTDQRVRMQACLTVSRIPDSLFDLHSKDILSELIKSSKLSMDEWNVGAVTIASRGIDTLLFKQLITDNHSSLTLLRSLSLSASKSPLHLKTLLVATNEIQDSERKKEVFKEISSNDFSGFDNSQLTSIIQKIEQSKDASLVSSMAKIRKQIGLPASSEYIEISQLSLTRIHESKRSEKDRLSDLSAIEMIPYKLKSETLFKCLDSREPLKIQEAALLQLSTYREKEIGNKIVSMWKELGPQIRKYASDLLIYVDVHHDALLTALEKKEIQLGEMNFDLERRRALLFWTDDISVKKRAEKLFSDVEITTRASVIAKMSPALTLKGDAVKGQVVFQNICSNCHMYKGFGYEVGPVLDEISRKSKEAIMHEILDPNAAVDTKYIQHRIETTNGQIQLGIISAENDQFLTILKMGGEESTIKKSNIKSLTSSGKSYMIEGLESVINPQQMADLLTYLQK